MASIERRPRSDGTIAYRVIWRDPDTSAKDSLTFDDEAEAERAKKFLNANGQRLSDAARALGKVRGNAPTITEILTGYVDHLTGIQERTRDDYRSYLTNHIDPFIGHIPIDHENLDGIAKEWVNEREDAGMGGKTMRNVHAFLSAGIGSAVPKHRPDNPFYGMRLPEYMPDEIVYLTQREFALLLAKVPPFYRLAVKFLVSTGVRWGEFVVLRVRDLELFGEIPAIRVTKALKRQRNGSYVGTTKTGRNGRRTVSIPELLVPELEEMTVGRDLDAPLFPGPRGARLRENNFRDRIWAPSIAAANAEYDQDQVFVPRAQRLNKSPRIHDLRHTHASWQIAAGVDMATVSRRLGHESIKTTVDIYGHLDPTQLSRSADAANAALLAIQG
ncbi:site-specific integrase [Amycolatopsis rhabdoformis]|uniref:Site-specific integrase n=1 Tax=Amycolatopsis rhabdoformis TaxID=1448059 RepID=A0ABZ1HWX2_9PSEU|nr:site-specific integrase [Amycolatopsis rhabdoformis]WSE26088.1 site-specific integrase [Amycolatopsis rhabdoformis]